LDGRQDIDEVIAGHVRARHAAVPGRRAVLDKLQGLLSLLGRGGEPEEATEEVFALLSLLGVDDELRDEVTAGLERVRALGIELSEALPVIQAYSRGVTRVVEAEANLIRTHVRQATDDDHSSVLDEFLTALLPIGMRGFDVLHVSLLGEMLRDELAQDQPDAHGMTPLCVALVDLCGSTAYLAKADSDATEQLVDALFEAGQMCIFDRPVRVLKYVGDGIYLVGRNPIEVAQASFAALDRLAATLPVPARAGMAYGPVLRRAGDYFGFAVNLAQLLTKKARPGTVLATSEAASEFPPAERGRRRSVRIGSQGDRLSVVALRRPDPR
jgi:class 3 adenylate cyclase